MQLVTDWRQAWKWISIQCVTAAAIWELLPPEAVAVVPDPWRGYVTLALLIAAGFGRVIDQGTGKA